MRIAIDGRTIINGKTGVGMYAERLLKSLIQIDRENQYTIFLVESSRELEAQNFKQEVIKGFNRMGLNRAWENFLLPRYLVKHSIDLYFSPAYVLPLLPRYKFNKPPHHTRYVVTIHDVIGLLFPETFTPKMRIWQTLFVSNATKAADKIITVSNATKRDILNFYPINESKICVVYNSAEERFRPISDRSILESVKSKYTLPDQFILYVGTIEPRKNILNLAKAYAVLPKELRQTYHLVIGGGLGWYSDSIKADIENLKLGKHIHMLGYIAHEDLPVLYNLASLFVFPSLYEGFGYPPLEAMACGIPVITSNTSSLPEVVGDAAILIHPQDTNQISSEMKRVLVNTSLKNELQRKGLERAKQFGWKKNAEETLKVFEEAMR